MRYIYSGSGIEEYQKANTQTLTINDSILASQTFRWKISSIDFEKTLFNFAIGTSLFPHSGYYLSRFFSRSVVTLAISTV